MYDYIKGILKAKQPHRIVLETGGIGYRIAIPLNTYTHLPAPETPLTLHLSQIVREDSNTLYGFLKTEERDLFEQLLTLSGIGPKTALSIIGHTDLATFQKAIASSDIRLLSRIPGIGKKSAERLVIELRDRLPKLSPTSQAPHLSDALAALLNLGYTHPQAQKALEKALQTHKDDADLGRLIASALQHI